MCYRKQGVNGPYFTHLTLPSVFFMSEMSSLINHVRFALLKHIFVVTYKKIGFIFVKITNVDILGTCVDPLTPNKFKIIQHIFLYVYTIEMH